MPTDNIKAGLQKLIQTSTITYAYVGKSRDYKFIDILACHTCGRRFVALRF
jgi:hypothetical protein